jgi:hypothetical protein
VCLIKKNINITVALQNKWMDVATFLSINAVQFCLLSHWPVVGVWAFRSSQRLSQTLLAVPKDFPTAFKSISRQMSAKPWQFHPFSLNGQILLTLINPIPGQALPSTGQSNKRKDTR